MTVKKLTTDPAYFGRFRFGRPNNNPRNSIGNFIRRIGNDIWTHHQNQILYVFKQTCFDTKVGSLGGIHHKMTTIGELEVARKMRPMCASTFVSYNLKIKSTCKIMLTCKQNFVNPNF